MDDELLQLEAELKSLQPSSPPRRLAARLERDLAAPACAAVSVSTSTAAPSTAAASARRPASAFWFWAAALPAAAALALGVGALMRRDLSLSREAASSAAAVEAAPAAPSRAQLKPVAAENILYSATDEGLVVLDDGTRARRERLNYVDTITWKNPRTNASLKWTVPREEIRFVPVNFQ